jgi:hypothetical protein
MRRIVGRLLILAAVVLPLSVAFWGEPAQASGVGHLVLNCGRFKGAMDVTPGLSNTATNQTVLAYGRVYGCNKAGGEAKFNATLQMTGATCTSRRFEGPAQFAWANGRTSTTFLTISRVPGTRTKYEVVGTTTGAFPDLLVRTGVRMSDTFTGSGPPCGPTNLLKRIDFTNNHCFMLYEPRTTTPTTTTVPHHSSTSEPAATVAVARLVSQRSVSGGGGGTQRPSGPTDSLALTGSHSGAALVGLWSLIVGGAIWALAGPGRHHDRSRLTPRRRHQRRRARPWLYVTMPNPV